MGEVIANEIPVQFPCGRVKRFLNNNPENKMRVGAKRLSSRRAPKFDPATVTNLYFSLLYSRRLRHRRA